MKPEKQLEIGYYTKTLEGHRQSYLDFVKNVFGGNRVEGISLIIRKQPVLFLMIEDNFLLYFIVGCIRALLGRKTAGLLFRPKPALEASNFRLKLKLVMLKLLKKIKSVQTLSIVPTTLEPKIATIVDDWIYDFQLWDITPKQRFIFHKIRNSDIDFDDFKKYEIANEVRAHAKDKKILIALGAQNKGKGIHVLSEHVDMFNQENYIIVVAGRFDKASAQQKKHLQDNDALVFDRFMTDEEILALYSVADVVWCYYDPSYDQASGILGRSIQLGVLPIVRSNSFSEKFCLIEKILHIAPKVLNKESLDIPVSVREVSHDEDRSCISNMEEISKQKLSYALGIK